MAHQSAITLLDSYDEDMVIVEGFLPLKAAPDGLGAQTQKKRTILDHKMHLRAWSLGSHANRDAQFKRIAELKLEYQTAGNPVVSIDTKKKEMLGNFHRAGKLECQAEIQVNDHDFGSAGVGKLIPHGIYDIRLNLGFLHLNTSHDTTEFACEREQPARCCLVSKTSLEL